MAKRRLLACGGAVLAALVGMASERIADGYGLVNALAGYAVTSGDPWPFYYYANAIDAGMGSQSTSLTINRDNPNAWAPACIYQLERYNKTMNTTFAGLVPNAAYKVELHLTENYFGGTGGGTGTGDRIWNVALNGVAAESNIDIYAQAGGAYKGLCKQYVATANAEGKIIVTITTVKDNGHFSGMAVFGTAVPSSLAFAAMQVGGNIEFTFEAKDVHRYYVEKAQTETGPWTQVAVYEPHLTAGTLVGAYDPTVTAYYRVVASNGVGTAVSPAVVFKTSGTTDHLATTGAVVADKPAAIYGVDTVGDPSAGNNTLAADSVSAMGYVLSANGNSILELFAGQTFTVGSLGVENVARTLAVQGEGKVAAKDGMLSISVKNEGGEVEVASVVDGGANGMVVKNGPGRATLSGPVVGVSSVIVGEGDLVVSFNADTSLPYAVSGNGKFVKSGAAELTLTNALPSLTGDFVVREGTLCFGKTGSQLPNTEGRLVIESGAALDVSSGGLTANDVKMGERKVIVSGAGPDGKGAIVNTAAESQYNSLTVGELAGDVVFGGGGTTKNADSGRWDFRNIGTVGSFTMNGHNVRKIGNNMVCLTGIAVEEGGPVHIDVDAGYWSSETTTSYSGGPENAFNIASGATLDFYNMSNPITWALNLANGAELKFRNGTVTQNQYTGPVTLAAGTANIFAGGGYHGTILGPISGPGMLKSEGGSGGRVTLKGTNTYEGGTWVSGGDLWAERRESLPGYDVDGKLTVTNGSLLVRAESGFWSERDIQDILDHGGIAKTVGSYLGAYVNEGVTTTWTDDFLMPYGSFTKGGLGTLTTTAAMTVPGGLLETREGTLVLDGANTHSLQRLAVRNTSTMVLTNGAAVTITVENGQNSAVGSQINNLATLVLGPGCSVAGTTDCSHDVATAGLLVGNSAGTGLVVIDDATVRHKFNLGTGDAKSQGAVIQNGGFVDNQGGAANDIRVGDVGYGYYELNDGELDWWGYGTIGSSAGAYGVMVQHGGLFKFAAKTAGRLGLSRGGDGTFYMDGGEVDFTKGSIVLSVGEQDSNTAGPGSQTSFTVDGTALARFSGSQNMIIGNRKDHTASVNLNGGVLQGGWFAANSTFDSTNRSTLVSLLNFNGGTFRSGGNNNLVTTQTYKRIDAATVFEGGAVFDPAGYTQTLNFPLDRPSGNGVVSIAVPSGLASATWLVGAPHVKITGGGGRGATAVCEYDSTARKVTGVKVTCPGTGYTEAPTVTFHGGGRTNVFTGTATIAANAVTGGLTVRSSTGTGVVRLSAANTFGGPVRVEGGTLQLIESDGFPAGADLVLDGGEFNAMGHTVTAGVVTVRGGTFTNGKLVCKRLQKEGAGDFTLNGARVEATLAFNGLYAGRLEGAFNVTDPNPCTEIVAAPTRANLRTGWSTNETWVYTGYIWNRGETDAKWTFAEFFDDSVLLKIDGKTLINATGWDTHTMSTVTLSPGPHAFELRLGQGTGEAGPSTCKDNADYKIWGDNLMGLGIDFQGRNSDAFENFVKFEDCANIDELFTYGWTGVEIGEGRVVVHGATGGSVGAGLQEGMLSGQSNWTDPNPCSAITLTTAKANTQEGWSENVTAVYSGYIWNRSDADVTWTLAEYFDDFTRVWIDDELVLSGLSWSDSVISTVTLTPGPHKFEVRFGQGSGGAGPSTNTSENNPPAGWVNYIGFAIDFQGRGTKDVGNFTFPVDPGDGSLFTLYPDETLEPFIGEVTLAADAQMVVDGADRLPIATLRASGTVTNGDVTVTGTLLADGAELAEGRCLTVTSGGFELAEGACVKIDGFDTLEKGTQYTLVSTTDGVTLPAKVALVGAPEKTAWTVYRKGRTLVLGYPAGGVIYLR